MPRPAAAMRCAPWGKVSSSSLPVSSASTSPPRSTTTSRTSWPPVTESTGRLLATSFSAFGSSQTSRSPAVSGTPAPSASACSRSFSEAATSSWACGPARSSVRPPARDVGGPPSTGRTVCCVATGGGAVRISRAGPRVAAAARAPTSVGGGTRGNPPACETVVRTGPRTSDGGVERSSARSRGGMTRRGGRDGAGGGGSGASSTGRLTASTIPSVSGAIRGGAARSAENTARSRRLAA